MSFLWNSKISPNLLSSTQDEITRVDNLSEQIGANQVLKHAFDPILNVILSALDAPPVFVRTKALRALSHILTVDHSVLSNVGILFWYHCIGAYYKSDQRTTSNRESPAR